MSDGQFVYQYETSPRKIKSDYNKQKRNALIYNKSKQKIKTKTKTKPKSKLKSTKIGKNKINAVNKKQEDINVNNNILKVKLYVFVKSVLLFLIIFFMIFMNTRLSESITQIQKLKAQITELQKENDQLAINIQNNINLNNIEQAAKELLGMQKLSNRQTLYINLPKTDYVEPRTERVIIEEKQPTIMENLMQKIKDIF